MSGYHSLVIGWSSSPGGPDVAKTAATGEVPGALDADENLVVNWWIRLVLRRSMVG